MTLLVIAVLFSNSHVVIVIKGALTVVEVSATLGINKLSLFATMSSAPAKLVVAMPTY